VEVLEGVPISLDIANITVTVPGAQAQGRLFAKYIDVSELGLSINGNGTFR